MQQLKEASCFIFLICCFYSVGAFAQVPLNNDFANAITVTHSTSWCTADGAYTTLNATADGPKGIAWTNGPNYNVWFKFQATATQVNVQLNLGSLRNPYLALWDSNKAEIKSAKYTNASSSIFVQSNSLTIGEWYYISVDNYSALGNRGTFSLCIEDQVDFDYKEGAIDVPHTGDWCSQDAEYTTVNGSPDGPKGSVWSSEPNANVWFKFKATTTQVNAEVKHGGTFGNGRYPLLALWDSSGSEITSVNFNNTAKTINIQSNNLTIGNWYYISVDNYSQASYRGSFTLCVDNKVNYDYREGAIQIPHTGDWCSTDAEYSTINATSDGVKGSAWATGPNYNVWFKFQATSTQVNAEVKKGDIHGDIRYAYIALWNEDGTEIKSTNYNDALSSINVQSNSLTVGNWYYISVDNHNSINYQGTFTFCLDNKVNYDYKEAAIEVPHTSSWCSEVDEYSTYHASPDETKGSNWFDGPNYNVWFKFQATTTQITAQIKIGDPAKNIRYPFLGLWDQAGAEIKSVNYNSPDGNISLQTNNLTIGDWYYISVDNRESIYYIGDFSLCIEDKVGNDYKEGAIEVPHTTSWCSENAEYSTYNASPDETKGSLWFDGPNDNVWFKFQATANEVNAHLKIGSPYGDMAYPYIAIWDAAGTEIKNSNYYNSYTSINTQSNNLTIGDWYYISVDNRDNINYRGTFSLCIEDKVDYDYKQAAIEVPHTSSWCSEDAEYSTIQASSDGEKGSLWFDGPNYNVWFKFQATATKVNAHVNIGGVYGTMDYPYIALWDNAGTEIKSKNYYTGSSPVNVQSDLLIIGDWYYISVDNRNNIYNRGTFSLCIEDVLDYDYKEAAIEVPHTSSWCSQDAAYSTVHASPDEEKGSAWFDGPNYNVWFKFQATTTKINAHVKIGDAYGTMDYPFIALWDTAGTEIKSSNYYNSNTDINAQSDDLIIGDWYYISVDNRNNTYNRGTFSLCIENALDYDYKEAAIEVPHTDSWCSEDAAYSNIHASPDEMKGSAWFDGPNFNVWFKFQATTTQISTELNIGGTYGTMDYPYIGLWDTAGTEIKSTNYTNNSSSIKLQSDGLIIGDWYYISVDNRNNIYNRGTFSLCIQDKVGYDYKEGALEVPHTTNWCSQNAEYSTVQGTPDGFKGSTWFDGPNYNVWFKFQATTTQVTAHLNIGGEFGNMDYPFIALWNNDGTEITSKRYTTSTGSINLQSPNLTIGDWYYITVDNRLNVSYKGTFSLCVEDKVDYDYYEGAIDVTSLINSCSADAIYTTAGASPDRNSGMAWNNSGPQYNRWFKFTAPPISGQFNILVDIGSEKGTQRGTQVALWKDGGTVEVNSTRYTSNTYADVTLTTAGLIPGDTYYISVDTYSSSSYTGTFSLCLENTFIDFNGKDYYVDFGNTQNFTGQFSLESWVLQKSNSGTAAIISKGDTKATGLRGYHLTIKEGFPNISWYDNSGNAILDLSSPYRITDNIWHHVASSFNGSTASLYLDGVLVASQNTAAPLNNVQSFLIGASYDSSSSSVKNNFNGFIDEVRVWNIGLTQQQIQDMMNQEIIQTEAAVSGKRTNQNVSDGLSWTNLRGYYPMNDNTATDHSSYNIDGSSINNTTSAQEQTAPLPYESATNGNWESPTTWLNNTVQYPPNSSMYGTQVNWNITQVNHSITNNTGHSVSALIVDTPATLTVKASDSLSVSRYLKLDGAINLEEDSQLIQGKYSELDVTSSGTLQKAQQGSADTFTYNYWSSPVGPQNTTNNNNSYKLPEIFNGVNFLTSGYNGSVSPLGIATAWIWKFSNKTSGDYAEWQHVGNTGSLLAGEGFSMKGPGSGTPSALQNYLLKGKPNNGDINLTITAGNDYLVGNPYPSAIDAKAFILDNGTTIAGLGSTTGTLYFWEHWGGNSHNLASYQGGYATYSLSGGVPAAAKGVSHSDVANTGVSTKTPGRYIPVSQGFFVTAEASGTIKFNNAQRVFQTEDGTNSVFLKSAPGKNTGTPVNNHDDLREKLRIGFYSTNTIKRQLLTTVDASASIGYDWGYDAPHIDYQIDDMYWLIDDGIYAIQGIDEITEDTVLPLGVHLKNQGVNIISLDDIENEATPYKIYLHDKLMDVYHNLRESDYEVTLIAGKYLDRFEITFSNTRTTLSTTASESRELPVDISFSNSSQSIVINNQNAIHIESITMYNMQGQSVYHFDTDSRQTTIAHPAKNLTTGGYIIKLETENGIMSKKVIVISNNQ
ncbi:LamG-like jellyroll fold domain-containing protein [Algibacter miyuki]|uniref:LamG-like jellyroll fold domain-containing protein n=1 Tax=Algibacter miyuki TaxID=1306933 RepID=A0ABV5H3D7_9FLAO|nr:LamG-like jellyroll fold domain-containing protein [Algibacter miyuki]MDN3665467.1 LamG domain-containing protein [Algibacter miyuki]